MNIDEKIKWVRDKVYELEKLVGLGVAYYSLLPVTQDFGVDDDILSFFGAFSATPPEPTERKSIVVLTVDEQLDILKRLEKDGLLKIEELDAKRAVLKVFPLHPCPIKLKTLEHISREISNAFTGTEIIDTLIDYGIPRCDISYPNTKWRTLQELFLALATSPNPDQRGKLGGAITVFLHPLNFHNDESAVQKLVTDFNNYLKYDGYEIKVNDDGDGYQLVVTSDKKKIVAPVVPLPESKVDKTPQSSAARVEDLSPSSNTEDYSDREEYETDRLRQPETAERLSVVRGAYKTLMAITSSFCSDPTTPSRELNTAYTELSQVVSRTLKGFCGDTSDFEVFTFDGYVKNNFGIPFSNLYKAELEFRDKGKKVHWDEMRPEMNAVLGQIEDICDTANASEIISDPKIQSTINNAMLILSQIAAERKDNTPKDTDRTLKMEITKVPELQIRNAEDVTITKGKKRIHLPKFKSTEWSKINIRFIDDRTVLITADKKEQVSSDYETLGFSNETRNKPNKAWVFLCELAKNDGSTKVLPVPIPDTVKQLKKQLSDRLKSIFKNDTDPFFDPTEDHVYRIKITLIPPMSENTAIDTLGTKEYLEETMTEIVE